MRKKLSLILLAGSIFALMVATPQVTPVSALQMEYFPLAPGNYNIFNSTNDQGTWMTKRYVGNEWEFLGGPYGVFTVYWCEAHMMPGETNYTWKNQMWLSKTSDTLVWWGFEDENAKITASSGLNYVTEPVTAGAIHSGSTTGTLILKASETSMPGVPFSANYTIEAIESVTVPAGTFDDCIRIHEEEITPDGAVSFWVWYAPNIGAVQYHYPDQEDRWDRLVDYGVDLENDPWDSWFMPSVPSIMMIATVVGALLIAVIAIVVVIHKRR
ncbi:MAG: hypothetical protein JW779_06855 [Candidatus Thorarchaeota archaeon]|nr:hypothetical protein [Candidatus Thorarchaeota archaeon]